MGRPNCNQSIQHFSHPHPLEIFNLQNQQPSFHLPPCAACKLQPYGLIYICKTCNFILHISCSEKPQLINHPSDPNHPLTLLPFPAYPDGAFTCDACGLRDTSFSYHCRACTLDLHIHCASMPMSLNHPAAHHHTLSLTTSPPPKDIIYTCDLCSRVVVNQWTYDCRPCDFGCHLSCANNPHAQVTYMRAAPNYRPNNGLGAAPTFHRSNSGLGEAVQGFVQGFTGNSGGSDHGGTSSAVGTITSLVMQNMFGSNLN